jgi:hypothetical protein
MKLKKPPLLERLRAKKSAGRGAVLGVCWYTEEGWARVKATATDAERFEVTYEEWRAMAEESLLDLSRTGLSPVKVTIDPDEFFAWCKRYGRKNNASARAAYVSAWLRRTGGGKAGTTS